MAREKLTRKAAETRLESLEGWTLAEDGISISRKFKFAGFVEAFGFMTQSALHAEKLDHHPEWSNVYRTVDVLLTTHDAKGLTELDFDLATRMNKIAAKY